MSALTTMKSPKLTEAQEKIIDDLNWTIKEIRQICRPWSNVPRDNQPMLDACDIFFWKLKDSGDVSLVWNKSLQATLNTIIPPQGFPEVYKHLVMWIFDVVSELGQKSELDKNVQWAIADVTAAAQAWVEMREENEEIDYNDRLIEFKWNVIISWKTVSHMLQNTRVTSENMELKITCNGDIIATFPIMDNSILSWKSLGEILNNLWDWNKWIERLPHSDEVWEVLTWLDESEIKDDKLRVKFFKDVLWLKNWTYVCSNLKENGECHIINLTDDFIVQT
jgi:hypothetical protein